MTSARKDSESVPPARKPGAEGGVATLGRVDQLTFRERAVAIGIVRGESNKRIAVRLGISPHTVRDYVSDLLLRFGEPTRARLAAKLLSLGLLLEERKAEERVAAYAVVVDLGRRRACVADRDRAMQAASLPSRAPNV